MLEKTRKYVRKVARKYARYEQVFQKYIKRNQQTRKFQNNTKSK